MMPASITTSLGQAAVDPSQNSATSHSPTCGRHSTDDGRIVQTPLAEAPSASEHASHAPPLQAALQQKLSTQKPLLQSDGTAQDAPLTAPAACAMPAATSIIIRISSEVTRAGTRPPLESGFKDFLPFKFYTQRSVSHNICNEGT